MTINWRKRVIFEPVFSFLHSTFLSNVKMMLLRNVILSSEYWANVLCYHDLLFTVCLPSHTRVDVTINYEGRYISVRHAHWYLYRYLPTCAIDNLRRTNPSSKINISSIAGNALYCNCLDAAWAQQYFVDFENAEEYDICALTPWSNLRAFAIRWASWDWSLHAIEGFRQLIPGRVSLL